MRVAAAALIALLITLILGELYLGSAKADDDVPPGYAVVVMPYCQFEDGNPDGKPCLWVDPNTGEGYLNSSSNYRFHEGGQQ